MKTAVYLLLIAGVLYITSLVVKAVADEKIKTNEHYQVETKDTLKSNI